MCLGELKKGLPPTKGIGYKVYDKIGEILRTPYYPKACLWGEGVCVVKVGYSDVTAWGKIYKDTVIVARRIKLLEMV